MIQPYLKKKLSDHTLIIIFMAYIALMLITACQTTSYEGDEGGTAEMNHDEDMADMDMAASDAHDGEMRQFVPNDDAEVHITAPANEASFKSSDTVPVTIETVDFTIGEDGNHWHIYLDGSPIMVMGGYTFVLQNLSAGQHDIEVYLSNGHHEDLEQGDTVTIIIEE